MFFLWNVSFSRFILNIQIRHTFVLYFDKRSHLNLLLWNRWTKIKEIWLGWSLGDPISILCPTAPPSIQNGCCYQKIGISLVVNFSNFNCSYMAMSSLTYILFFVRSHQNLLLRNLSWNDLRLAHFQIMCNTPFSINFRCQIENQVSDYRLLWASSFNWWSKCRLILRRQGQITPGETRKHLFSG